MTFTDLSKIVQLTEKSYKSQLSVNNSKNGIVHSHHIELFHSNNIVKMFTSAKVINPTKWFYTTFITKHECLLFFRAIQPLWADCLAAK